MAYTVKITADLTGVSIRALHYYDEIGLLKPASTSSAGYRLYTDADLERLQQILFFRELDFSLEDIRIILDDPAFDRKEALLMHRKLLDEKRQRLAEIMKAVDGTIDAIERETDMSKEEMFAGFDKARLEEYQEEARQRWGNTPAWAESQRRTSRYTKKDWSAIGQDSNEINQELAARMDRNPSDEEVQALVARWHRLINERFYTCPPHMFRALGNMYVEDSRFTAFYDKVKPGLAEFLRKAIHVYTDRLERNK